MKRSAPMESTTQQPYDDTGTTAPAPLTQARLGFTAMRRVVYVCLVAIAVNAVVIQTVVTDEASPLKNVVRASVLLLAGFATLLDGTKLPRWLVCATLLSCALMLLRNNPDQLSYIFVFLIVPLLWSIPERDAERAVVFGALVSFGLIFAFLAAGVTHNVVLDYRSRATFGTQGVPFFFNVVYGAATMATLYSYKYCLRRRHLTLAACLAVTTYLYLQTDARGGYFAFLIFVVLLWLVPLFSTWSLFRGVTAVLPVIFIGSSFFLASLASNPAADKFFSYRPQLISLFLQNVSLDSFVLSTSVKQFSSYVLAVRTVDNSYLHLLVGGGIVLAALYVYAFGSSVLHLFQLKRYPEIAFLISASAYFNSEGILLRIENVFVIYAWYLVLRYARIGSRDRGDRRVRSPRTRPDLAARPRIHSHTDLRPTQLGRSSRGPA